MPKSKADETRIYVAETGIRLSFGLAEAMEPHDRLFLVTGRPVFHAKFTLSICICAKGSHGIKYLEVDADTTIFLHIKN